MVRSKGELVIANMLAERGLAYAYERPLEVAPGRWLFPDFTIAFRGQEFYWEHLGMLGMEDYDERWSRKLELYKDAGLTDCLILTDERDGIDSIAIADIIKRRFGI